MAALESSAMKKARKLVQEEGITPYAAAVKVGISRSAIYMAPWYKEWKKCEAKKKPAAAKRGSTATK